MSNTFKLTRLPSVVEQTGYSRSAIYQKVGEGSFPQPVKLGPRAVAWVQSEVDEWCANRIEKSRKMHGTQADDA